MADVFGMAARLVMQGEPVDRFIQGLDDEARMRLAWLCLRKCEAFPSTWMDTGGKPDGAIPDFVVPVRLTTQDPKATTDHILISQCKGAASRECTVCAAFVCHYGDGMHFHHDGCPSCASADEALPTIPWDVAPDLTPAERAQVEREVAADFHRWRLASSNRDPWARVQAGLLMARQRLEAVLTARPCYCEELRRAGDGSVCAPCVTRREADHPERTSTHAEDR